MIALVLAVSSRRLLNYSERSLRRLISTDCFDLDDLFKTLEARTARRLLDASPATPQKWI